MSACPKAALHTKAPESYLAWHAWAEKKAERHYQVPCPGCGLLAIWRRKPSVERELEDARRTDAYVATLGDLYGRPCFAGALGGVADGRPSTHVVFPFSVIREHPVPVCRYHAAASTRLGMGAWKLPVVSDTAQEPRE